MMYEYQMVEPSPTILQDRKRPGGLAPGVVSRAKNLMIEERL